jgi:hypothetical protein
MAAGSWLSRLPPWAYGTIEVMLRPPALGFATRMPKERRQRQLQASRSRPRFSSRGMWMSLASWKSPCSVPASGRIKSNLRFRRSFTSKILTSLPRFRPLDGDRTGEDCGFPAKRLAWLWTSASSGGNVEAGFRDELRCAAQHVDRDPLAALDSQDRLPRGIEKA